MRWKKKWLATHVHPQFQQALKSRPVYTTITKVFVRLSQKRPFWSKAWCWSGKICLKNSAFRVKCNSPFSAGVNDLRFCEKFAYHVMFKMHYKFMFPFISKNILSNESLQFIRARPLLHFYPQNGLVHFTPSKQMITFYCQSRLVHKRQS